MECRSRLRLLTAAAITIAIAASGPTPSRATVFTTRAQALAEAFPGARIETRSFVLDQTQMKEIEKRAKVKLDSQLATAHLAWHGDTLVGTAFVDARVVRTMPAVFMVVITPEATIDRIEVLAFHEPPDYQPSDRWLAQFQRHKLNDGLRPRKDIRNLGGATLSTRAVTESARVALACYEVLVAPRLPRAEKKRGR